MLLASLLLVVPARADDAFDAARATEQLVEEVSAQIAAGDFEGVLAKVAGLGDQSIDPRLRNAQGVALAGLGRDREAVQAYEQGIRTNPALSELHLNLAISLQRLGVTGRAMAEFQQAVDLAPGSFEAHLGLGRALLRYKRLTQARVELERARDLDGEDPRAWTALAELADAEGDPRAMREAWGVLERRWPDARTARRLGELARDEDDQAARTWFETCLQRDPRDAGCAGAAGALALAANDLPAARRLLTTSMELDEQPGVLHDLLLSYQIGDDIEGLERVVERWPPQEARSWGVVALARRKAGDRKGALAAAKSAVEAAPADLDLVNLLAVLLEENGESEEAVARWEWILQQDANYDQARRNLARRKR